MNMKVLENVKLNFSPQFKLQEGVEEGSRMIIGGTALVEGVSRNGVNYRINNLQENAGKEFKWLVGHPREAEDHIVGKGQFSLEGGKLNHEGWIRNTAKHPDVVESVRDGFLGPSIHATASKVEKNDDGHFVVEGLEIDGVGLVAFQGVKQASIDYAIAESFDRFEQTESNEDENTNGDQEVIQMPEEEKPVEEVPEEQPAKEEPVADEAPAEESSDVEERLKVLQEELASLKESKKVEIVESLMKMNKDFDKDALMKESVDQLNLREEYERKLAESVSEEAIVESEEEKPKEETLVESKGALSVSEKAVKSFNDELREWIR
jgi:hypothetical protein